jgi:hypothetical protein
MPALEYNTVTEPIREIGVQSAGAAGKRDIITVSKWSEGKETGDKRPPAP